MDELLKARNQIDVIDRQIADLFEQRMQVVGDVAKYKLKTGKPIFDASREAAVIEKNSAFIKNEDLKGDYATFMKDFMNVSKSYQRRLIFGKKIAFQGVEGAFSHIASLRLFPNSNLVSYPTFLSVIEAVENDEIECGVLPYENSTAGEVGEVMDLLFNHSDLYITGYYDLKVEQNLLGVKGATIEDVKEVYSHPQALEQSAPYIDANGWSKITYRNTAEAAKYIASENDKTKAAIASIETADIYGLDVLATKINSSSVNTTRFAIVSKRQMTSGEKFSLFFTVANAAGSLAKAVDIISETGFNMSCLRSRAMRDLPWEYYFFAEVSGSLNDEKATVMLEKLKKVCGVVRVLGCYSQIM